MTRSILYSLFYHYHHIFQTVATMKVKFSVNLLLIISALQNYPIVYAYEEPLAKLWNVSYSMLPTLSGYETNLMKVDNRIQDLLEQERYLTSIGGTFIDMPRNKLHINVLSDAM